MRIAGIGKDLSWFWKNWFFEKLVPDLGISNVILKNQKYQVTINNIGGAFMPVHLSLLFADGSKKQLVMNSQCWQKGNKAVTLTIPAKRRLTRIQLGSPYDADANRSNNQFEL